jgi:cell division septation protein DedD
VISQYFPWRGKYNGRTPLEVRNLKRHTRGIRRAIVAAVAAVLGVLIIGAADMMIWPDASGSLESAALAIAPGNPVEPEPTAAAVAVAIPVAEPSLQGAVVMKSPLPSPTASQPAVADTRSPNIAASVTPADSADIKKRDPSGYVIQVAAAPQLEEARAVLAQLAVSGHPAYLTAKIVDGVELYRVRVGPFTSRSAAEDVARRLEHEGHRGLWVTK